MTRPVNVGVEGGALTGLSVVLGSDPLEGRGPLSAWCSRAVLRSTPGMPHVFPAASWEVCFLMTLQAEMSDAEAQGENCLVQGWLESVGPECELKSVPCQGVVGRPRPRPADCGRSPL